MGFKCDFSHVHPDLYTPFPSLRQRHPLLFYLGGVRVSEHCPAWIVFLDVPKGLAFLETKDWSTVSHIGKQYAASCLSSAILGSGRDCSVVGKPVDTSQSARMRRARVKRSAVGNPGGAMPPK